MKPKTCPVCKQVFEPFKIGQKTCCWECALALVKKKRIAEETRADRKTIKLKKESLKTKRDYTKEAQIAFNAYIRERDQQRTCICCGKQLATGSVGGAFDCGHYRSVGSAPHLRFDERNAHAQRKQCNRWGAGRAVDYRIGLVARIGREAVEALEADQTPKHYTIDELKAIAAYYKAKLKEVKANAAENNQDCCGQ